MKITNTICYLCLILTFIALNYKCSVSQSTGNIKKDTIYHCVDYSELNRKVDYYQLEFENDSIYYITDLYSGNIKSINIYDKTSDVMYTHGFEYKYLSEQDTLMFYPANNIHFCVIYDLGENINLIENYEWLELMSVINFFNRFEITDTVLITDYLENFTDRYIDNVSSLKYWKGKSIDSQIENIPKPGN